MAQQPSTCLVDLDCPGAEICMTNTSWYEGPGNGCICSTWYGFDGVDCTGTNTLTSNFWLGSALVILAACVIGCIFSFLNAWRLYQGKRFNLTDSTAAANVQLFFTFAFMAVVQIITAIEAKYPSMVTQAPTPTAEKIATTKLTREIFEILSVLCAILASLTIALVWIEVAERARRMMHRRAESVIPQTRKIIFTSQIILTICMVASVAANLVSISLVFGIAAVLSIAGVYAFGYYRLMVELKSMNSGAGGSGKAVYADVIREIQGIALGTAISSIALFAICVALAIMSFDDWKQTGRPGVIPPSVIAWQLLPVFILLLGFTLIYGLRKATARKIGAGKTSEESSSKQSKHKSGGYDPSKGSPPAPLKTELSGIGSSPLTPTALSAYQVSEHALA